MIGQDINAMVLSLEWMRDTGSQEFDEMREATAGMVRAMANMQLKMGQMNHSDHRDLLKRADGLLPSQLDN
jgi:hypothetical protein